jgi:hypothetical protein
MNASRSASNTKSYQQGERRLDLLFIPAGLG